MDPWVVLLSFLVDKSIGKKLCSVVSLIEFVILV